MNSKEIKVYEDIIMTSKKLNLIYAIQSDNLIHVSDVPKGLNCNCTCPACGGTLIARKGEKVIHHFAHYKAEECKYGYETSLHLAAKQMIADAKEFMIPPVYLNFPESGKEDILLSEANLVKADNVFLEQHEGDMIPDIVVISNNKKIFIEIYVSHAIDELKLIKLKDKGISTIEIDLSGYERSISKEELQKIILHGVEQKRWIYNSFEDKILEKFISISKYMPVIERNYALHIDYCPINVREWRGKPYANVMDDCSYCEFCVSYKDPKKILCSGKERIATLDDFKKTLEERINFYDQKCDDEKFEAFSKRICPNCGGKLIDRIGKFGDFIGCSSYPHCRFTANIDMETGEIIMKA
jgi:ssDNA-binding Zn-finger/Zn-ribbon topoisomerase 1